MRSVSTTNASVIVLESLDNAWDPLIGRTNGMTQEEFLWEPVRGCWSVRPDDHGLWRADWADPDPVPAPVATIAWRCWHIAVDCLDNYSARLFGARGTGLSGTSWVAEWPAARSLLEAAWATFRSGVAAWGERDLFTPLGAAWGEFANHCNLDLALHASREIIHHGAEIALLRDLYLAREGDIE